MKILVVSNMYPDDKHPFYGTFVKSFCTQLKDINVDYDLSVMIKKDGKINKIIEYARFYLTTFFNVLFKKYDVIYIHYASHSSLPVILAKKIKPNIKIYTNVHGSDVIPGNSKQEKMQKYTRRILMLSNKIIVPSEYFKGVVCNKYSVNEDLIVVYPSGGVNPNVFYPITNKDSIYQKYNLNPNYTYIGFVSRIVKDKGWDIYCEALKKVVEKKEDVKGILIGSGPETNKLYQLIEQLNLTNNLYLFPSFPQSDLNEFYNIFDCLVFSSKCNESLGLIPLEAMACGKIVIANNFAAPAQYIRNGVDGYLYDTNDSTSLANKINECLNLNQNNLSILCSNALKKSAEYYPTNTNIILKELFYDR